MRSTHFHCSQRVQLIHCIVLYQRTSFYCPLNFSQSKMPTAAVKVEKQPTVDQNADVQKQLQQLFDKKVRNLEKRKTKLQALREEKKELNDEQKQAIKKYDGVIEIIDFLKELGTSIGSIFAEHQKVQKSLAKKEQRDRQLQEVERIKNILIFQDILNNIEPGVKKDLLNGTNGALKLTEERMGHIDELFNQVSPSIVEKNTEEYKKSVDHAAEVLFALGEGKNRDLVKGVTFKQMKECLNDIYNSGYFQNKNKVEVPPLSEPSNVGLVIADSSSNSKQLLPPISFMPDNGIEIDPTKRDPTNPIDPAIVAVAAGPGYYQHTYVTQNNDSYGGQLPTTNAQKIVAGYTTTIPSQTYTNQSYATVNPMMQPITNFVPVTLPAGAVLLPTLPPQNISPPQATNELTMQMTPQNQQNFIEQQQGFSHFGQENQQQTTSQERGNFNQDDNYGQKGNYRNSGRGGRGKGNTNGYGRDNRLGQNRYNNRNNDRSDKGGSFGMFQSNRENYNGTNPGNSYKPKNQYSGNRGPQYRNERNENRENRGNFTRNKI